MSAFIPEGVIFDVDGVLFDSERLHLQAWEAVSRELGCPQAAEHYLEFVGRTRQDDAAHMARLFGPGFPAERFLQAASLHCRARIAAEGLPLKPGVRELLTFLQDRGVPAALATSTYMERTLERLETAGLGQYFQSITTGDQVVRGKPDPEIYQTACRRLGTDPTRAIAVEDSRNGILSAHGAGIRVVMIPDLVPPTPELDALLWRRFDSLLELRDYLSQLL